ncbi:MAG: AraC family transcriptional regulator [Ottowia sp.]|uniref:AraC family transcriptional regulator n=1 Tax=Ottowia sp. TaxID=1898956 RepID=UPI0039E258D0
MNTPDLAPAPRTSLRLSGLAQPRQLQAVREHLADLARVDFNPLHEGEPLCYQSRLRTVPGATWGGAWSRPVGFARTAQLCKDGQDDVMLVMPSVPMTIEQPGREPLRLAPGDAALLSLARPQRIVMEQPGATWALRVPHADLARRLPRLEGSPMRALNPRAPTLQLLRRYGRLLESEPLRGPAAQHLAARHLQDMLAMALRESPDGGDACADQDSLRAARVQAVRADMAAHLASGYLSLPWLAARQGLSVRHLQRLLAAAGTSYQEALRHARLQAAHAMLLEPRNAGLSISAIAHACGFSEASALNRAYKQHYGMTPGQARWDGSVNQK